MTPEARARQSIDALLVAAGWAVQDLMEGAIVTGFGRRLSMIREVKAEVFAKVQRAQVLRLSTFEKACSVC